MKKLLQTLAYIILCILIPIAFGIQVYRGTENGGGATVASFILFILFTHGFMHYINENKK